MINNRYDTRFPIRQTLVPDTSVGMREGQSRASIDKTSPIGKGKFGTVLKAYDTLTGEPVAIKYETSDNNTSPLRASIKHETKIMTYLFQNRFRNLPYVYWYGSQNNIQYLVMTYYNYSLESYIKEETLRLLAEERSSGDKRRDATLLENLFSQCICILESIHKLYVLHRDIKPENFMIKDDGKVHLIDYGLSTFWINGEGEHIANIKQETITGTPKYVSYYNYIGNTISRRDDLISLGYMMMYFMYGYLPWKSDGDSKKWESILDFLENESPIFPGFEEMGSYTKIKHYMRYCYSLEFNDTPNYRILHELFYTI